MGPVGANAQRLASKSGEYLADGFPTLERRVRVGPPQAGAEAGEGTGPWMPF